MASSRLLVLVGRPLTKKKENTMKDVNKRMQPVSANDGWTAVDLDGTLAKYNKWKGPTDIGDPVPLMVERVKRWLDEGKNVRIFTARVWPLGTAKEASLEYDDSRMKDARAAALAIHKWCREHLGQTLPITCVKDPGMTDLWDDRAIAIEKNKGYETTRGVATAIPYEEEK